MASKEPNVSLDHSTVFTDESRVAKLLPLNHFPYHDGGTAVFPLTVDPIVDKKSAIIGMFVLRAAEDCWIDPALDSMYSVPK